jgi:hypothetical protein
MSAVIHLIQTSQTGGQRYNILPPLVFPGSINRVALPMHARLYFQGGEEGGLAQLLHFLAYSYFTIGLATVVN